jgi:hypothetical protein
MELTGSVNFEFWKDYIAWGAENCRYTNCGKHKWKRTHRKCMYMYVNNIKWM